MLSVWILSVWVGAANPDATPAAPAAQIGDMAGEQAPMADGALQHAPLSLGEAHAQRLVRDTPTNLTMAELYITGIYYGAVTGNALLYGMANLSHRTAGPLLTVPIAGGIAGAYYLSHATPRLRGGVLSAVDFGLVAGVVDSGLLLVALTPSHTFWRGTGRAQLTGTWALATASGAVSGYVAHKYGATQGDMAIVATTTLWGAVTGLLLNSIVMSHSTSQSFRLGSASMLIGSLAGTGAGVALASHYDFSRARAWFLDLGAAVGMCSALSAIRGSGIESTNGRAGMLLGGEVLGLAAAAVLTRTLDTPELALPLAMQLGPAPIAYSSAAATGTAYVPGLALSGAF